VQRAGPGRQIAGERQVGWTRQLRISPLSARAYLSAKAEADDRLAASGLDFTIVRPGRLTDEDATGLVSASSRRQRGTIPRADVAATLAAVLDAPSTIGATFDLVSGETPIADALAGQGWDGATFHARHNHRTSRADTRT